MWLTITFTCAMYSPDAPHRAQSQDVFNFLAIGIFFKITKYHPNLLVILLTLLSTYIFLGIKVPLIAEFILSHAVFRQLTSRRHHAWSS
jgi:hypothetical protein